MAKVSESKQRMMDLFSNQSDAAKEVRFGDLEYGCFRYVLGRNKMRELAEEANAVIRIGRLWRFDVHKMDNYFANLAE